MNPPRIWSDHPARTPRLLGLLAAALVAVSGTEARAVPTNVNRIPNGIQFDCLNCHRDLNGGPRNAFMGMDFEINEQRWAMIFDLDSDGDGQTNGEELGDPCGVWPKRRTPTRTTDISNPSVRGSRSSGLTPIDCEALRAEVEAELAAAADEGGCRSTGRRADGLTFAVALGAVALRARRRRLYDRTTGSVR